MPISQGRERAHDVNVNKAEAAAGDRNRPYRCSRQRGDLALAATLTHQAAPSEAHFFQTKRESNRQREARMPGCARRCMASNTNRRWQLGTTGLMLPVDMSQTRWVSATLKALKTSEEECRAAMSGQECCAAAMATRPILDNAVSAITATIPSWLSGSAAGNASRQPPTTWRAL